MKMFAAIILGIMLSGMTLFAIFCLGMVVYTALKG